ncbi:MAG: PadR family transcriptional regulator [Candidatus Bathyarchaeota archaeon]|nr:PadR family transcriptional regulator [Candidatus Bathyarchaeota archaeon]
MDQQNDVCCAPTCCDMRGFLSFTILWQLMKKDMYGQELAKALEKMRGTKPNPGTLYPALKELEKNGMVTTREEGRKKIYTLTEKGRVGAQEACDYFCRVYAPIFEEYNQSKEQVTQV